MSTPFWDFLFLFFLLRKTSFPSHWISYQLFQTVEFDYSTCPKFLSTNIYIKYRLFLQVRAKNLEAPALALPGLLVAKRRKRDLNPRAAWTTYTLSRGASSASWVFLQISIWMTSATNILLCIIFDASFIIQKPLGFVNAFYIILKYLCIYHSIFVCFFWGFDSCRLYKIISKFSRVA